MSQQILTVDLSSLPVDLLSFDIILINSSAGKDSQAMLAYICLLAAELGILDRVIVVHADLGEAEWDGTKEMAAAQAERWGVRFIVCSRTQDTLLEYVEKRKAWPSSSARYCTSEFKRAPIQKVMTALANELHGNKRDSKKNPSQLGRRVRILNCMGLRAEESPKRAEMETVEDNSRATNKNRKEVVDWLPIHDWTEEEVWAYINRHYSQDLIHNAYKLGMPRLSCRFCVMGCRNSLMIAGEHNPELLDIYCETEERISHNFAGKDYKYSIRKIRDDLKAGLRGKPHVVVGSPNYKPGMATTKAQPVKCM